MEYATCQAEALYPELWEGLAGAWSPHLNPRGGIKLYDLSERQNHGTLTNMDPATDWVVSQGYGALNFVEDDWVAVGGLNWNAITAPLSFSIWCNPIGGETYNGVLGQTSTSSTRNGIFWDVTNIYWRLTNQIAKSRSLLVNNSLNHIVCTSTSLTGRIFINGVDLGTGTTNGPNNGFSQTLAIGALQGSTYDFDGSICDVLYYRRVLEPAEVSLLYSLGPGGWAERRRRRVGVAAAAAYIDNTRNYLSHILGAA